MMIDRPLDCLIAGEEVRAQRTLPIHAVRPESLDGLLATLDPPAAAWTRAQGFRAKPGELVKLPGPSGVAGALLGLGAAPSGGQTQGPQAFGGLASALATPPDGDAPLSVPAVWRLVLPDDVTPDEAVLGFCLGAYRFTRFKAMAGLPARLVQPAGSERGAAIARSIWLVRDLINLPANHLGPDELAIAARDVLLPFGAEVEIAQGDGLANDYPALAAVGAGSVRPPRVVVARWSGSGAGAGAPLLSLVGKGVCFDTGGYDLKPSAGMLRMKKDMGGAAIMLGLARLVMARDLPLRLELRLGCVENSVSGSAMRPSDILATRKGLTVEIGNTDAEGRLVLADLLAEAAEAGPDLLLDAATLTGAARVALGPDLPALFCNDDDVAQRLLTAGAAAHDPLWRLPLWDGYDDWLSSPVADLNNVSSKPMAGALTAALFLQRFVPKSIRWAHIDTYGWNDSARAGRPEGGEALGLRALYAGLLPILNLIDGPEHSGNIIGTEPSVI